MSKPVVDILGYREWAHELQRIVANQCGDVDVHWHETLEAVCYSVGVGAPVFAVGWSEIITEGYYTTRPFFVLHPAPLPRYAGGSPIQHQIIAGEKTSAVTIFKLDPAYPQVDSGPIAWSMPYSLEGDLADILKQIAMIGSIGVATIISAGQDRGWEKLPLLPQALEPLPLPHRRLQRRTPADSELTTDMLTGWTAEQLHNFVRALQDPYPNAFIRTFDGGRLYITKTRAEKDPFGDKP